MTKLAVALAFLFGFFLKTLAVFWLVANVVTTASRLRAFTTALAVLAVPLAAVGIHNFATGTLAEGTERIVGYEAPLTTNPNDLALMLNLVLPLVLGRMMLARRVVGRLALGAIAITMAAAVVTTYSRAGFLTLLKRQGVDTSAVERLA